MKSNQQNEPKAKNKYTRLLIIDTVLALVIWSVLVLPKCIGEQDISWSALLISYLWISREVFITTAVFEFVINLIDELINKIDAALKSGG